MNKKTYTAIVFFPDEVLKRPRKYRKISNLHNFCNFCLKIGSRYINLYDTETKQFEKRIYLTYK